MFHFSQRASLMVATLCLFAGLLFDLLPLPRLEAAALEPLPGWRRVGVVWIDTTKSGADLPADALVEQFPVLVRLQRDFFDFATARPDGADVRFTTPDQRLLPFQVDHWSPAEGVAAFWVRVPQIRGGEQQSIHMHWGRDDADPAARPTDVFNSTNGFLSVWHLDSAGSDSVGTLTGVDRGTHDAPGVIGPARRFEEGRGLFGGDRITSLPHGADSHSTSLWCRPARPNATLVGWGNEKAQGKVVMQHRSPPHIRMDCYFSNGNVASDAPVPLHQWTHVVHTYAADGARIYINGRLAGENRDRGSPLKIQSPARFWLGGWYDRYDYVGELDEVRIASVARSPAWIRLEFENQRPDSPLVGPLVQPGDAFSVEPRLLELDETASATLTAQAGGARRVYWTLTRDGVTSVVATNRFSYKFAADRTRGPQRATLAFHAVYADQTRVLEIPVTIRESHPEPIFTLAAPRRWNGREPLTVTPQLNNRDALVAAKVDAVAVRWSLDGVAVSKRTDGSTLKLLRAQGDGPLRITARLDNGGPAVEQSVELEVEEPPRAEEPWTPRPSLAAEHPVDGQFIPRERVAQLGDAARGQIVYAGQLEHPADEVILRVFSGDKLITSQTQAPTADRRYSLTVAIPAALVHYRTELMVKRGDAMEIVHQAQDLVCGDVYLICGQSNAVATDFGREDPPASSPWVRTFGATDGGLPGARLELWADAQARAPGGKSEIGYWGLVLGQRLVDKHHVPVCILNGAVGGTRIDQHQRRDDDPTDPSTIYGRLLWRVRQAGLAHAVRAILWHQGENDQGADGPTGGYGYETYKQYFIDLAAAWKEDYPNVERYYVFQIWPKSCAMGVDGSDNRLREVQRNLPRAFSNLSVMSTLGVKPPGGCHFPAAGYAQFAALLQPLVDHQLYGAPAAALPFTPPNLVRATFVESRRDAVSLEFDSPVVWNDRLKDQFHFPGADAKVIGAQVVDRRLLLTLSKPLSVEPSASGPTREPTVTYLDSARWNPDNLLYGVNGIAALTFCEVVVE
ncbi:MAG: DUF2341 domain-containing protein [Pirellulales bacterium]